MLRRRAVLLLVALLPLQAWPTPGVDAAVPDYERVSGVAGNFSTVGSDTMNNLMALWAHQFQRLYPGVTIEIQGAGSSTAPPALAAGTADLGLMSRRMKASELEAFQRRHGYRPTVVRVGLDALAVFVNKDNPLTRMTLQEVDAVFSVTRRCGQPEAITRWGRLGLSGGWKKRPIELYSRNSVSGTYGHFKQEALCRGDFRPDVNEQPGSASVVDAVGSGLGAIGYSGIGYRTSGVRPLRLARRPGGPYVEPSARTTVDGSYPLSRYLYMYVNKTPDAPLPPLEREFLKMVLSRQGQAVVLEDGYVPLPGPTVARERHRLQ